MARAFSDNEQFEFDRAKGRMFKAYCADRPDSVVRLVDGLYRFTLRDGDLARSIDKNRADKPNRSMIAGYGSTSIARPGATVFMRWTELFLPVPGGKLRGSHINTAQLNQQSDAGETGRPPLTFEKRMESTTASNLRHILRIQASTLPGRNTAGQNPPVEDLIVIPDYDPFRENAFAVEFKDSQGGPGGRIKVELNGKLVLDHTGPTAFENEQGVYPGWGIYRDPRDQAVTSLLVDPQYEWA